MSITFFQISIDEAAKQRSDQIRNYVKGLPDTDFDVADKGQMCELIAAKHRFPDMPEFVTSEIERDEPVFAQGSPQVRVKVYFPYKGDVTLFQLHHRSRPLAPPPPTFEDGQGVLTKTYVIDKRRMDTIDHLVEEDIGLVRKYLQPVQDVIPILNQSLLAVACEAFDIRAHELMDNKQAAAKLSESRITLRKRSDGFENIIVPLKRQSITVKQSSTTVDLAREYVLGITEYNDILKTISSMVKVMERTPSVFALMSEEPLRTLLLFALNGIYEGQATGETFNGHGKTDILIRCDDRNVFIAECLMWKGPAYLREKIDGQLFQYAMWRDSKLALIIFNRGGSFTNTIETMRATVKAHPQCINQMEWEHDSGARYMFRRHDDQARHFLLTALAFDVPT